MELTQLQPKHLEIIRRFVNSDEFVEIKDAFISHTPEKGKEGREGDSDSKLFGKFLGTRYVFNELEKIARQTPQQAEQAKKLQQQRRSSGGKDPDLD